MARKTPHHKQATAFLKFVRKKPEFSVKRTKHARERMAENGIALPAIRTVLRRGRLIHAETDIRTGLEKYRISGRDPDGRPLEVVVNLEETDQGRVTVITVFPSEDSTTGRQRREGGRK
ncbi:MAG: DUF4258 domain-containing protein [Rhodobacteraceae bacterium]|nr:DUF4258 domain-containing protein [Paracoccaceae bacterium]